MLANTSQVCFPAFIAARIFYHICGAVVVYRVFVLQILLDEDWIANNSKTTQDIKDYCSDIKVLGRKEIKALITWRKDLR